MKTVSTVIFAGVILCGSSLAQDATQPRTTSTAPPSQQGPATAQSAQSSAGQVNTSPRIAPGSVIPVQLLKSIDAKKVKTGDEVTAKVTQDMKTGSGEIVVPKDMQVIGHITEVQVRSKEKKESQVGIAFDHAAMKPGGEIPLPMSIQAIIASPRGDSDNNNATGENAPSPAPGASAGGMSPGNGGRSAGAGTGTASPAPSPSTSGSGGSTNSQEKKVDHPITGDTQGVVGISNLKLSTASSTAVGSVVSSEKSNVKLESGTLMLLRVIP